SGWVRNETDRVWIELQGEPAAIDAFLTALKQNLPPRARIDSIVVNQIDVVPATDGRAAFEILPSREMATRRPALPADLATCEACLAEIRSPRERRYGYPFTNCTNCGPRWSIIEAVPYDRPRTSMRDFTMCEACRAEYANPADRRFHAQPIGCPECGPELRLLDPSGDFLARGDEALRAAAGAILQGKIVAMKGLGGFQLLVDATNGEAVQQLRRRKRRPAKPFAVMIGSLDESREYCEIDGREAAILTSPAAPIVLLRRRGAMPTLDQKPSRDREGAVEALHAQPPLPHGRGSEKFAEKLTDSLIAEEVAPGNPYLGVMLPYTPLHHLLMDRLRRPIVCTSGNLAEEPMATTTAEAIERLGRIADVVLTHNRPIVRPVDDSVVRSDSTGPVVLRRARGYSPLPIELNEDGPITLAVGGHLKNAVALRLGRQVVVGSHVGDLDSPQSWDVHRRAVDDLLSFFDVRPEVIACDMHPDYLSTQHAERLAGEWRVPLVRVQHHHAHVAACMAEHGLTGPVLGLAWDGTGYGPDGTVWGGEALGCEGPAMRRVAHLRQFALPGGDQAVRRPRRSALGALFELDPELAERWSAEWYAPSRGRTLLAMLRRGAHCPRTSSLGRLFDAVAALCGLADNILEESQDDLGLQRVPLLAEIPEKSPPERRHCLPESVDVPKSRKQCDPRRDGTAPAASSGTRDGEPVVSFEGQAAMALEFNADWDCDEAYSFPLSDGEPMAADWGPAIQAVLADRAAGVPVGRISARWHNGLAQMAVDIVQRAGCSQVALSGGCFQNRLLTERVRAALAAAGFNVYTHQMVPAGDGGIALGQAYLAGESAYRGAIRD
ncbi:MAG TPA: carbamoyltransferase HypF, partial [Thermoguttaceae bacterium]|nr:carbamoyltransferase HypF [Thermoguttaceae bacterium]